MKKEGSRDFLKVIIFLLIAVLIFKQFTGVGHTSFANLIGFAVFTLQPNPPTAPQASQVRLDITVTNITNLAGVQISLTYNQNVLSFVRAEERNFLNSSGTAQTIFLNTLNTTQAGLVKDLAIVRISGGANGSGTVASLYFNANNVGTSNMVFTTILLSDNQGNPLTTTSVNGVITVVDSTNPTATVTSPAQGAPVLGVIQITATASDNVGVAGVQFMVDGTNVGAEDTSSPYQVAWNSSTVANGNHAITAVARDTSNNLGTSTTITVNVNNPLPDLTPPGVSNGQPTGTLPQGTTSTTMSVVTNESATCRYSTTPNVAYNSMTNTFSTTGGLTHSQSLNGLSDLNTYVHYVKCQDVAGNTNPSDFSINFSVAGILACGAQGAFICGVAEVCPGTNITASDTTRCCNIPCVTPSWTFCSQCGSGLFNICDKLECYSISQQCYFVQGITTVSCNPCAGASCSNYADSVSCAEDHCSFANCSWSGSSCIAVDLNPPNVTGVAVSVLNLSSASITWTSTEPTTHQVEYGNTTAYGQTTIQTSIFTLAHTQVLTDLFSKNYNFRIISRDVSGNIGTSNNFVFTINVTAEGDLNGDRNVNILDLNLVVQDFSKTTGFNPAVDVAPPLNSIDLFDVMVVIRNWERSY